MEDLSLHVLDIAENAVRASAKRIEIMVVEDKEKDLLTIEIKDDGQGMDETKLKKAIRPFYTTKSRGRIGLGLSLLVQSVREGGGGLVVNSIPGKGTQIKASFRYTHPDRKPLGDMAQTMLTLIAGYPQLDFVYEHRVDNSVYRLNSREMKKRQEEQ